MRSHRSEPGIDALRGLAVALMFVAHVWRVQHRGNHIPSSVDGFATWLFRAFETQVSFTAASFLMLVGFSLVLARRAAHRAGHARWYRRHLRRAGMLYLLGIVLFVAQFGWVWPDVFVSADILSVIAIAIALTVASLITPKPNIALGVVAVLSIVAAAWTEHAHLVIPGLNAGPGGAVPLVLFAAVGAMAARVYLSRRLTGLAVLAAVTSPLWIASVVFDWPWTSYVISIYPDMGQLAIQEWIVGAPPVAQRYHNISFWNPTALGSLGLVFPVLAGAILAIVSGRHPVSLRATAPLRLIGRHALLPYVMHLGVLGVLDLTGASPTSSTVSWLLWAGLMAGALCLSWAVETTKVGRGGLRARLSSHRWLLIER